MRAPSHYRWLLSIIFLVIQSPLEAQTPSDNSNATTNESRRIVILTFDDSAKTHFTFVRPILLKYGFGGTFFITEGWDFATNKRDYMTWEEIAQLSRDGFEIGNHTRDHMGVQEKNLDRLEEQLDAIAQRCKEHNIPKPITFAWPGNSITPKAFPSFKLMEFSLLDGEVSLSNRTNQARDSPLSPERITLCFYLRR